ncbi:MAG: hypothetical protein GTN89_13275 [Acidobacteria bacterium]|nr:hypothetical protein [Acidobacteriota bacterium]NIM60218.1 hypothetical protein [Acidobacteriota bacterium]NIO60256.1 hypothetical protein [Acidobacteriota bacterium]NIQ31311.1 hypothetical protein [Acidobacteriota bacterium]NIQ86534.1 hypothetical protein [Acidobacteriota bacterium]
MKKSLTTARPIAPLLLLLLATPLVAQVKNHEDIKYPPLPEREIPRPTVHRLANGLQLFLIEDHELPLISVSGRIRTGSNYEPAGKAGLADFVGQVMREGGTSKMDGDAMDDYLESRAAFVETGMRGDFGSASMNCLTEDFDDVLGVFADVLRNPAFAEDKLELAKQQAKTGIARRNDDIAGIAGREFARLIHGYESPLAQMVEYASVASITRGDLVAWHERYYHPNNIMLGIVGDFDSGEMKAKIEAAFGDWPRGADADLPEIRVAPPRPGVHFIEKDDVTQAYVRLGHRGIRADNPDYYAVQMMNEIFGGGFSSRLFNNVRSEKGLAYNVGGGVGSGFLREGIFSVQLSTKSESMAASIDALRAEIDDILASPPTDHEMSRAREAIFNSWVFRSTSMRQILGQQLTYAYYGYPPDFLERYRAGIEKVTREDVARVARQYIQPDKLVTLVVGKSADFDRPVSAFGEVHVVDISIPEPVSSGPAITRTEESLATGRALLARSAALLNGGNAAATSIEGDYAIEFSMGSQTVSVSQRVAYELPDKLRQTFTTPMGEQTVVINGNQGVVLVGDSRQSVPGSDVSRMHQDLNRDLLLLVGRADEAEPAAGAAESIDGTACTVVSVKLNGTESTLCIAEDGTIVSQAYTGVHPMRRTPGEIRVIYSDYRKIDGYLVPHRRVMEFDGQALASMSTTSVAINTELDATTFEVGK